MCHEKACFLLKFHLSSLKFDVHPSFVDRWKKLNKIKAIKHKNNFFSYTLTDSRRVGFDFSCIRRNVHEKNVKKELPAGLCKTLHPARKFFNFSNKKRKEGQLDLPFLFCIYFKSPIFFFKNIFFIFSKKVYKNDASRE